jgi:hypothetical protein
MSILDSKEILKELYLPPADDFVVVDVPELRYIMVDGEGDPDGDLFPHLTRWLFAVVHPLRLHGRKLMGKHFVEPPLECLWWSQDIQDLIARKRDKLQWRLMIVADADWITPKLFDEGVEQASQRLGNVPSGLRLKSFAEGQSVQIMHIGAPGSQATSMARMHNEYLPANKLLPNGHHHEIYLNDPRRVAPDKLKTVLRQAVQRVPMRIP